MPTSPASSPAPTRKRFLRLTDSVPLLVTVIVHVVLVAVAGYFVVSEQIQAKKKSFEGSTSANDTVLQKQVEHRLQIARKGGGSASASPVSANRIFSTSENALQLPAMPDLPSMGASALSGMGFGAGAGGVGTGTGYGTGLGSGNGLGSGFMSMSFLGTTSQRASKIVFVVEVGTELLDVRKGGFEAFAIIRDQMLQLINRLPPNAEFGVVIYEADRWGGGNNPQLKTFLPTLQPATSSNKTRFFEWMKPINLTPESLGLQSVPAGSPWRAKSLPSAGLVDNFDPPTWVGALRCALEMGPDTIFVVAGTAGRPIRKLTDQELAKSKKLNDQRFADLLPPGSTRESVHAARAAAMSKVRAQMDIINAKLRAGGKPPYILKAGDVRRIMDPDFQASLKQNGFSIQLDTKGWTTKNGQPIWSMDVSDFALTDYSLVLTEIAKLQRALLKERAVLNVFLFVGPSEQPTAEMENLGKVSSRNGGRFQLLTTKKLRELSRSDKEKK